MIGQVIYGSTDNEWKKNPDTVIEEDADRPENITPAVLFQIWEERTELFQHELLDAILPAPGAECGLARLEARPAGNFASGSIWVEAWGSSG
jgi:hypothetical protein